MGNDVHHLLRDLGLIHRKVTEIEFVLKPQHVLLLGIDEFQQTKGGGALHPLATGERVLRKLDEVLLNTINDRHREFEVTPEDKDHEFVARAAIEDVVARRNRDEIGGDHRQDVVADRMAVGVVDGFEFVEVEEAEIAIAPVFANVAFERIEIEEARETVFVGSRDVLIDRIQPRISVEIDEEAA